MTIDLKKLAEIKRYAPYRMLSYHDGPHMFETLHGGYVDFDDHQAAIALLQQEVETLRGKLNDYRAELKACQEKTGIYAQHTGEDGETKP